MMSTASKELFSYEKRPAKRQNGPRMVALVAIGIWLMFATYRSEFLGTLPPGSEPSPELCQQPPELAPQKHRSLSVNLGDTYSTSEFKARAAEWLGGAVRVPTESFDDMDSVGVDPRWNAFGPLHDYLLTAFPLIHSTLELSTVNKYSLVYHWKGSDASLKPILLAAHQDVVPVHPATIDQWTHPPFSGHFDGENIWGRGSWDDKSGLIATMSAVESLLESRFQPTRSVVLAFGFDEEINGVQGARLIAEHLEATFGKDAFALIIDEGSGFLEQHGAVIANLGTAEKGYFDTRIQVNAKGGHSSVPPEHTGIGILSALLVHFEKNPIEARLSRGTPVYETVQCLGAHAPLLPPVIRRAIAKSVNSDSALKQVEKYFFESPGFKALVSTTQAVDLIGGGVKVNALPEEAWAVVNHRIATDGSLSALKEHDAGVLKELATGYNLSYTAFGEEVLESSESSQGSLTVSPAFHAGLEPAPVTPTSGRKAVAYRLLSGTVKATYNAHRSLEGSDNIFVSPGIMSGGTDTRYYWNLSQHIFRYNHQNGSVEQALKNGIHSVDEHIAADTFVEEIRFFTTLILNADESTEL